VKEAILGALAGLPPLLKVAIVSALPIFEVRGGIPVGMAQGLPLAEILPIAIIANVLIVIPILLWFNRIADWLIARGIFTGIVRRLIARARAKKPMVDKYGVYALTLFVAVPLPVTGAYTGALVAAVFEMSFWRAVICLTIGVVIASIIVTALSVAGFYSYNAVAG
jgi:uncharacterized membrane protein